MPKKYQVKLSDGRTVLVEADAPPSEADVLSALGGGERPAPAASHAPAQEAEAPLKGMLPTAGSLVGSTIGTVGGYPGRVAGAAIGGALGKGAELLLDDKSDSVTDALKSMGGEALMQGGYEAAGGLAGKGLKALAPKLAEVALAPIESVARKYPNIGQTFVGEGKLFAGLRGGVGAVGKRESTDAARGLMLESRAATKSAIGAADAAGAPTVSGRRIISDLRPIYDEAGIAAKTGKADARPQILERAKSFARQNRDITNTEADTLRKSLDTSSDAAHVAANRMGQPVGLEAQMDKALAGSLRSQVRTNVPGVQDMAGRTRDLAGLTKALDKAATRKHLLTRNLAITAGAAGVGGGLLTGDPEKGAGAGAGTLLASYLLTNPRNIGRLALASHGAGAIAEWTPQMIRAAILASALGSNPEEETPPR